MLGGRDEFLAWTVLASPIRLAGITSRPKRFGPNTACGLTTRCLATLWPWRHRLYGRGYAVLSLQAAFAGLKVEAPALYMVGTRDTGLAMPGMKQMIEAQYELAPQLREPIFLEACGH